MLAEVGIPEPGTGWIVTGLVAERPLQHQDLLAAPVPVRVEARAGSPAHQRDVLRGELVQRQDLETGRNTRQPRRGVRVDHDPAPVLGVELAQLDENLTAVRRMRRVRGSRWVADVGPRRVLTMLVHEHALEHQELLAERVGVRVKTAARRVAHDAGGPCDFTADAVERLAVHARRRRGPPPGIRRVDHDTLREVRVDRLLHCASALTAGPSLLRTNTRVRSSCRSRSPRPRSRRAGCRSCHTC